MSFFKNVLNKVSNKSSKDVRTLTNVNQLLVDDIIVLTDSFGLPESLRGQQFQISAVNSYEFENNTQTEWTLKGSHNSLLFLSLEEDDNIELKFSLKIEHDDVESLFDLDDFSEIFDEPGSAFLTRKNDTNNTQGWSSEQYQQSTFAKVGYFHRQDHRNTTLSAYEGEGSGEQFELHVLYNEDQSKGIDIEVWLDGDTDIFLTFFRPTSDIVDMYPGS